MRDAASKSLPLKQIIELSQGKKVVSTNGCFDLLHWGHLSYLESAKKLGDLLIIGINSDRSVKALKGPTRPIFPEKVRALQLAALESVDFVFIFDEDTPVTFLEQLKPAIHVKGGDYDPSQLPEREVVEKNGGKVICLPFIDGYSTTSLIQSLLRHP